MELRPELREQLERFTGNFRVRIPHKLGIDLEDGGLVRWHPGSGYEITDKGRDELSHPPQSRGGAASHQHSNPEK